METEQLYLAASQRIDDAIAERSSHLDLSNLGLIELPERLREIRASLRSLDLSGNELQVSENFPELLVSLEHLERLNLSNNRIEELSEDIRHLKKLKYLSLQNNYLTSLPDQIRSLESLTSLNISHNKFTVFPTAIKDLEYLEQLFFGKNFLEDIPEFIGQLSRLGVLDVSGNQITRLPKAIDALSELEKLNLSHNNLTNLPDDISSLHNLTELNLSANNISVLPTVMRDMQKLQRLDISGNLFFIPEDLKSPQEIFEYHFATQKKRLLECKIVVIGEENSGKTSLIRQLTGIQSEAEDLDAPGIVVTSLKAIVSISGEQQSIVTLNFWDFGHEEIIHASNQFFFTRRGIYLLVIDSTVLPDRRRVDYWMRIIQSIGSTSPIFIVCTKTDQKSSHIKYAIMKDRYTNVVEVYETSVTDRRGIDSLKAAILEQATRLIDAQAPVPQAWLNIKRQLQERQVGFIRYDEYEDLCNANGMNNTMEQKNFLSLLHDLGSVIHFQTALRLEPIVILNPRWLTAGVHKLLKSPVLANNKGTLTPQLLSEILNMPEYEHSSQKHYIVGLMEKFDLAYSIESEEYFLVPELLPKDEPPDFHFPGKPAFEFRYDFLPSNVFTRFLGKLNSNIHNELVWRTGVVLRNGEATALVREDTAENRILISINTEGDELFDEQRELLRSIINIFDQVNSSLPKLVAQKRVYVLKKPNIEPQSYEFLKKLLDEKVSTYYVADGNEPYLQTISELLNMIEPISTKTSVKENEQFTFGPNATNIVVKGNVTGTLIVGRDNKVENSYKVESAAIGSELKVSLTELIEKVDSIKRRLGEAAPPELDKNLTDLVEEVIKPTPRKEWYSVSIDGLTKAAKNLNELGEPVIQLARKILSLLQMV
jgi:internalin A